MRLISVEPKPASLLVGNTEGSHSSVWNTAAVRQLRSAITMTHKERAIIVGCVMGDGSLIPTSSGKSFRFSIAHCDEQHAYLQWKFEQLRRWVLSPPFHRSATNSWSFRTMSHSAFTEMERRFYTARRKRVPSDIGVDLHNPLTMAVWFMDDGCRYPQGSFVINSQSFNAHEHDVLRRALQKRYGISPTLQRDHGHLRLYIPVADARRLAEHLREYVVPSMRYKLDGPVETSPSRNGVMVARTLA